jgi:hypothetical protein
MDAILSWRSEKKGRSLVMMKKGMKILFAVLAAAVCTASLAADAATCKKTGKNCPMNDNQKCNCGKDCSC